MGKEPAESEDFEKCGPLHLKNVKWSVLDQRRTVMASLVNGVYIHERDRQKKRTLAAALAPNWWESFHFQRVKNLTDENDNSIVGVIFEYKHPDPNHKHNQLRDDNQCRPPKYVIAIRGTFTKWRTFFEDIRQDMKYGFNVNSKSTRYQTVLQEVRDLIGQPNVSPENVWLTGHSLGATIALQVGKTMAMEGCHIDAYLFNPPFWSVPIVMLTKSFLKYGVRFGKDVITAGLYFAFKKGRTTLRSGDQFAVLRNWVPYLFVNRNDPICSEYTGHFEYRKALEKSGMDFLDKIASTNSSKSLFFSAFGGDADPVHLLPSAHIVNNLYSYYDDKLCHSLSQWWDPDTKCDTELYIQRVLLVTGRILQRVFCERKWLEGTRWAPSMCSPTHISWVFCERKWYPSSFVTDMVCLQ